VEQSEVRVMEDLLGYFFLGVIIIGVVALLYLPIYFRMRGRIAAIRQAFFVAFAGIIFVILFATLLSNIVSQVNMGELFSIQEKKLNIKPFQWADGTWSMNENKMMVQVVANILMFMPFGFLLPIVFLNLRKFHRTLLCVFLSSFSIEALQYFIGGSSDIDDLILNLAGGIFGYLVYSLFHLVFRRTKLWKTAMGIIHSK